MIDNEKRRPPQGRRSESLIAILDERVAELTRGLDALDARVTVLEHKAVTR